MENLEIITEIPAENQKITILKLVGSLTFETNKKLENTIQELIDSNKVHLLMDCSQLEYINSAGIGLLLLVFGRAKKLDGNVKLMCVSSKIRSIFRLTGLFHNFEIYDTRESALASFPENLNN
jgi:anti-anti-sigma factor